MSTTEKGQVEPESTVREIVLSHLRCIELQARLLLLASVIEGFTLQGKDIRCLGIFLGDFADKLKKRLKEI